MQLLRLKLENWRAVQTREIVLNAGVNIVEGANEAGKSSFIEALNYLIRERDSTKKKELKSVTPKGKDVGSSVEVELKTGDYHLTYSKTFNKRPATTLHMHAPEILQFTGLEAHDKVLSILDETIDVGLWQAIQLEQGAEFTELNLRQSSGLARALDTAAGGAGAGSDDSVIVERARKEYLRYYTERTARETNELAAVRKQVEGLHEAIAQAELAMCGMQDKVDVSSNLSAGLQEQRSVIPELKVSFDKLLKRQVEIDSLQDERRLINARCDTHKLQIVGFIRQQEEHRTLVKQLDEQKQALATAEAALTGFKKRRSELDSLLNSIALQREPLLSGRSKTEETIQQLNSALQRQSDVQEFSTLSTRLSHYNSARRELEGCTDELHTLRVDDKALEKIDALQHQQRELKVRLSARQPELVITALTDEVIGAGPVAAGDTHKPDTSRAFELEIGQSARVSFKPATDLDELTTKLADVDASLAQQLQRYSVESASAAVQVNRKRIALLERIKSLQKTCDEAVEGDVQQLQQRVEFLRSQNLDSQSSSSGYDIYEQLRVARGALAEIDQQLLKLNTDRENLQREAAGLDARLELAGGHLSADQKSIDECNAQLLAVSGRLPADADVLAEQTSLETLQNKLQEIDASLALNGAQEISQQVDVARQAYERANKELHYDETELVRVNAQLDQLKAEGLHEKIEKLFADLTDAQEQLNQLMRFANAAKCLWEVLGRHQHATQRSYAKPLSERLRHMGRIVFGEDFAVQLNESLVIESRTLQGATVPFDDLSGGAKEQLGILLRLAATQLVSGLPLILDDTLGHTDANRLQTMGSLLSSAGRQAQIVVMTCYPQRYRHVGSASVHRLYAQTGARIGVGDSV